MLLKSLASAANNHSNKTLEKEQQALLAGLPNEVKLHQAATHPRARSEDGASAVLGTISNAGSAVEPEIVSPRGGSSGDADGGGGGGGVSDGRVGGRACVVHCWALWWWCGAG